jgi:hypothetical protein
MHPFDFEADLKRQMHELFAEYGYRIPYRNELHEMVTEYLTIHKKFIDIRPRTVLVNPELLVKLPRHPKRKEISGIQSALVAGENINLFQSKRLFQSRFHDHLLYEWNIAHFHLSLERERKHGFVKQTDQLLFVYLDEDTAVLLDTAKHEKGIFASTRWQEILEIHFPHILAPFVDSTITKVYPEVDAVGRQMLWDKGYTLGMTEINGKVIHSTGIGRSTTGHSMIVMKTANELLRWVHNISLICRDQFEQLAILFDLDPVKTILKLVFTDTIDIIDQYSGKKIVSFPDYLQLGGDQVS